MVRRSLEEHLLDWGCSDSGFYGERTVQEQSHDHYNGLLGQSRYLNGVVGFLEDQDQPSVSDIETLRSAEEILRRLARGYYEKANGLINLSPYDYFPLYPLSDDISFENYLKARCFDIMHSISEFGRGEAIREDLRVRYQSDSVEFALVSGFDYWSNSTDYFVYYLPQKRDEMDLLFELVKSHIEIGDYDLHNCKYVNLTDEMMKEIGVVKE